MTLNGFKLQPEKAESALPGPNGVTVCKLYFEGVMITICQELRTDQALFLRLSVGELICPTERAGVLVNLPMGREASICGD